MTKEGISSNIKAELERAEQSLCAAEALLKLDLNADAVSRAYYGVFHLLRAILFSKGLEPKSHSGAIHLFNTDFVRPGLFSSANNRLIAGLQRARELADYDAAAFGKCSEQITVCFTDFNLALGATPVIGNLRKHN
jgi:hypothetical protein